MLEQIIDQLITTGRILWEEGLVTSHGGNLSCRFKDSIIITKTGTKLGFLKEEDFVLVPLHGKPSDYPEASSELIVHLKIYENTEAKAVIHAHPPFTVALSLNLTEIVPIDIEGKLTFRKCPVIEVEKASASVELSEKVTEQLKNHKIICVKGHGTFCAAQTLEETLFFTSAVEFTSKIIFLNSLLSL